MYLYTYISRTVAVRKDTLLSGQYDLSQRRPAAALVFSNDVIRNEETRDRPCEPSNWVIARAVGFLWTADEGARRSTPGAGPARKLAQQCSPVTLCFIYFIHTILSASPPSAGTSLHANAICSTISAKRTITLFFQFPV